MAAVLKPGERRLLVVTDHIFLSHAGRIYDMYCFGRDFFDDYARVFDQVRVAARVRPAEPPASARRADGDGVEFAPLPAARGVGRLLPSLRFRTALKEAVGWADAVCLRIPSLAGAAAFTLARGRGTPIMFELIGDPVAALPAERYGPVAAFYARWQARATRAIIRASVAGSYVSRSHLQVRYAPGPATVHASISSIRLPAASLRPAREFAVPPTPLSVALVASFVPIKCHDVLIRGVAAAIARGVPVMLHLIGDGPLRARLENLTAACGLTGRVTFHGHVADRLQIDALLDSSDLFAMTSASEGMPRAMIEAMSRGLPAIGADVGGIAELLPPAQRFPAGDAAALGRLLVRLQSDPGALAAAARHSAATAADFTQERLTEQRRMLLSVLSRAAEAARCAR